MPGIHNKDVYDNQSWNNTILVLTIGTTLLVIVGSYIDFKKCQLNFTFVTSSI